MSDTLVDSGGTPVLVCSADGPAISTPQDALEVIGSAFGRADVVAIPAGRLDDSFFRLRSGLAGEIMQKFVNYRIRLAVVGDIADHVAASDALRDLVRESNRRRHVWFVRDLDELTGHLQHAG